MNLENQLELKVCPYCGVDKPLISNVSGFNTDRHSGGYQRFWKAYSCRSCGGVVIASSLLPNGPIVDLYPSGTGETYDFEHLPGEVATDFKEALSCYSIGSFNAFAAMCRRTVQSVSETLGAKGGDKVLAQLKDLKEMAEIDDETFTVLNQIVVAGHDGAHPHLPKLSPERAGVLLELMKDVLYQLFVRKAKVHDAIKLRKEALGDRSKPPSA